MCCANNKQCTRTLHMHWRSTLRRFYLRRKNCTSSSIPHSYTALDARATARASDHRAAASERGAARAGRAVRRVGVTARARFTAAAIESVCVRAASGVVARAGRGRGAQWRRRARGESARSRRTCERPETANSLMPRARARLT